MSTNNSPFVPSGSPSPPSQSQPASTGTDGGGLATSATLYLYTFLATLVLLLVVSAAIVVRSFVLRRRHRMMIEEAIRNGTLLPAVLGAGYGSRPRVDLSKKPMLWDTWIEKPEQPVSGRSREKEWYWDMIKPFSAVYVAPPTGGSTNDDRNSSNRNGTSTPRQTPLRIRVGSAARHAGRTIAYYVSTRSSMNTPHASSHPSSSHVTLPVVLSNLDSGNATVRVAVLVAMPRKPPTKEPPSNLRSTLSSTSSSPSSQSPSPPIVQSGEDEEQLPHLEVGVTEIKVVPISEDIAQEGKRSTATE